ncbi:unnamed protein product [Urochloa decumbens]|uniref:Uncharacterized protein n=1 Tax=Urochloa decumbens TaxID=240449 RepID=A0ABC8WWI9_9POAL
MAGLLQLVKDLYFGPPPGKGVIQDLEYAMRTKGGLTKEEDTRLRVINLIPTASFVLFGGLGSYAGWFFQGLGDKLRGLSPSPGFARFCAAAGGAYIIGNAMYRGTLHACPVTILESEEGRMKMELANMCGLFNQRFSLWHQVFLITCFINIVLIFTCLIINRILTKHSDDVYLVKAVKKHFFAEHLFDDMHQDQPLFRWHPRRSYTDTAYVERMKEIEAINSDDEARSVSRETDADNVSYWFTVTKSTICQKRVYTYFVNAVVHLNFQIFHCKMKLFLKFCLQRPSGDLMEDPLACVLGSPGDVESNNPSGNTSTVLKRSELRARRRSHRHHHHRHVDDKFAAL